MTSVDFQHVLKRKELRYVLIVKNSLAKNITNISFSMNNC